LGFELLSAELVGGRGNLASFFLGGEKKLLTKKQMEEFMPSEEAIKLMHQRYPVHSTFIMDQMMSPLSSAGWFLAGYLFGKDRDLSQKGFDQTASLIGEGNLMKKAYNA